MKDSLTKESGLRAEVAVLEEAFAAGDHFRVALLSPQLLVCIVEVLAEYSNHYLRRKGYLELSAEEQRVNECMKCLMRNESDRAQIAGALATIFDAERQSDPEAVAKFESAFNKLEALVSMRNRLAHEFYTKAPTAHSLKASAMGGLELVRMLAAELEDA